MAMSLEERIAELLNDARDHDRLDVEAVLKGAGFAHQSFPEIETDVWKHEAWGMKVTLDTRRRSLPIRYLEDIMFDIQRQLEKERGAHG